MKKLQVKLTQKQLEEIAISAYAKALTAINEAMVSLMALDENIDEVEAESSLGNILFNALKLCGNQMNAGYGERGVKMGANIIKEDISKEFEFAPEPVSTPEPEPEPAPQPEPQPEPAPEPFNLEAELSKIAQENCLEIETVKLAFEAKSRQNEIVDIVNEELKKAPIEFKRFSGDTKIISRKADFLALFLDSSAKEKINKGGADSYGAASGNGVTYSQIENIKTLFKQFREKMN